MAFTERTEPTEDSNNLSEYNLPVVDVQKERRNFKGYQTYPNMLPYWDTAGTTETDSKTDTKQPSYTNIYKR